MVQGYKSQGGGSESLLLSFAAGTGEGKGGRCAAEGRGYLVGEHIGGLARRRGLPLRRVNL